MWDWQGPDGPRYDVGVLEGAPWKTVTRLARRLALVARHHLSGSGGGLAEVIDDLVALHSSDPLSPHLGLWARVEGYTPDTLEAGMPADLWRLHAMRRTLWVAPSAAVGHLDAAVGQTVLSKEWRKLVGWTESVRPDAERWLRELGDAVVAEVGARPGIHTRELQEALPDLSTKITVGSGKWTTEEPVGSRLLFCLAMELRLARRSTRGTWKASQYGWCVAPSVDRPTAAEGRTWLVRRHVERFGPVTTTDIRWWTGLTAAQVRKALEATAAEVVQTEDGDAWMLPDQELPEARGVSLLPGLDPTPMGYKERAWFLGDHGDVLFDRNGNVGPTIWQDGRVVGGWAVDSDGVVRTRLLEGHVDNRALAERVDALQAWLGGLSVTPRFRTPLERDLVG